MTIDLTIWQQLLNYSIAVSVILAAIAFAVAQWRNNTNRASAETVNMYRCELDAVKITLERLSSEGAVKDQRISQVTLTIEKLLSEGMEKDQRISKLQGQVDVLKELPLNDIASTLRDIAKSNHDLMQINLRVLKRLESDAITLRADTKKAVIKADHVATAVEHVKTDLENTK